MDPRTWQPISRPPNHSPPRTAPLLKDKINTKREGKRIERERETDTCCCSSDVCGLGSGVHDGLRGPLGLLAEGLQVSAQDLRVDPGDHLDPGAVGRRHGEATLQPAIDHEAAGLLSPRITEQKMSKSSDAGDLCNL